MKSISGMWDSVLNKLNPSSHVKRLWNDQQTTNTQRTHINLHEVICFIIMFIVLLYSFFGHYIVSLPLDSEIAEVDQAVLPFESFQHILGTDAFGRDLLDVFLLGTHKSFFVAICIVLFCGIVIMPLATLAGYYIHGQGVIANFFTPLNYFMPVTIFILMAAIFQASITTATIAVSIHAIIYCFATIYREVNQLMDKALVRNLQLDGATLKHILYLVLLPTLIPHYARTLRRILTLSVTELMIIGVLQLGIEPKSLYWGNLLYQAWKAREVNPYTVVIITILVAIILYASVVCFYVVERIINERMDYLRNKWRQKRQANFRRSV